MICGRNVVRSLRGIEERLLIDHFEMGGIGRMATGE